MQSAMYCTDRQWCDLVGLTKSLHVERIQADPNFKSTILPKIRDFYFTAILPELACLQAVIREPTQWVTKEWKQIYMNLINGENDCICN